MELHPVDQRRKTPRISAVEHLAPLGPVTNQPRTLQHPKMFRRHGLRHMSAVRQRPDGLFAIADQALEDRATGRIAQAFEHQIGNG